MKKFSEFSQVKKIRTNPSKAKNLIIEAQNRLEFLNTIETEKKNSNYIIENIYDIIRNLIEAKMSLDGYKSYSHEATVTYAGSLGFSKARICDIDELRRIRNGIKYDGKKTSLDYAKKSLVLLEKVYDPLVLKVEISLKNC